MSDADTVVLVGCGAAKQSQPAPARDLYTSTYFDLKRRYAEALGDRWYVLSAEHGVVEPEQVLDPYDTTMSDVEEGAWRDDVLDDLQDIACGSSMVFLAGKDYTEPLRGRVGNARYPFDETSGIGGQMGWLSSQIKALEGER